MSTEFTPDEAMPAAQVPETQPETVTETETQPQPQPQPEVPMPEPMPVAQPQPESPMSQQQPRPEVPTVEPAPVSAPEPTFAPMPEPMAGPMPMPQPPAPDMNMNPAPYQYPVQYPMPAPGARPARKRRGLFVAGWLVSALAVGTGAGFGILAATGTSKTSMTGFGVPAVASPTPTPTPSPSVTSGVRPDGTHYGSVKDFLLPIPDGYKAGPDEGDFGNDGSIPADQADPTVELLFGSLPASDMSTAQGALTAGHMSDGAVRTYESQTGELDISVTVLRLDPAQSAESTKQFESVVKLSRAFRIGPKVPGHPDALCVLPATAVGETLDGMICLGTVGDTFAIARAEGSVPLDATAVTKLFGQQLDLLKGGLGT